MSSSLHLSVIEVSDRGALVRAEERINLAKVGPNVPVLELRETYAVLRRDETWKSWPELEELRRKTDAPWAQVCARARAMWAKQASASESKGAPRVAADMPPQSIRQRIGTASDEELRVLRDFFGSPVLERHYRTLREEIRGELNRRCGERGHPRRVPSKVVPGYSCPDCGAVFRDRT